MRVTTEEAMRLIDQFTEYVEGLVGQDVQYQRNPDMFSVALLRKRSRVAYPSHEHTGLQGQPFEHFLHGEMDGFGN